METRIALFRKKIATGLIAFASAFTIAMVRFEQNPQSCGMVTVQMKKKNNQPEKI